MWEWLAMAAAAPAIAAHGAQAPVALRIPERSSPAHQPSMHVPVATDVSPVLPSLVSDGMVLRNSIAPNASLGLRFATVAGKRRSGDLRTGQRSARSHRPALTFRLKF